MKIEKIPVFPGHFGKRYLGQYLLNFDCVRGPPTPLFRPTIMPGLVPICNNSKCVVVRVRSRSQIAYANSFQYEHVHQLHFPLPIDADSAQERHQHDFAKLNQNDL